MEVEYRVDYSPLLSLHICRDRVVVIENSIYENIRSIRDVTNHNQKRLLFTTPVLSPTTTSGYVVVV